MRAKAFKKARHGLDRVMREVINHTFNTPDRRIVTHVGQLHIDIYRVEYIWWSKSDSDDVRLGDFIVWTRTSPANMQRYICSDLIEVRRVLRKALGLTSEG